jgi:putative ABC transport system permease protein
MLNDLRYAVRTLLKSPGFTVAALVVLALGIGANTAMFGAINSVLLRPLPFPDADRLVVVRETRAQARFARTVVSEGEFLAWMRDSPVLEHAAIVDYPGVALRIGDTPERVPTLRVPADFFPLFGVTPVAGRAFTREEEQPGRGDVLLISHDVWQRRFGGAADAIGRTVTLEGRPAVLIGVLPRGFRFGGRVEAIIPMTLGSAEAAQFAGHSYDAYARLPRGVTRDHAVQELTRRAVANQGPTNHSTGAALVPMQDEVVGEARQPMLILFAAVGVVLLIACANIANLLLARAAARQTEIAVRSALGATRGRIVRQLVTESLLLSAAGGMLGLLLGMWLTDLLARAAADALPRADEIGIDGWGLVFGLTVSAAAGLLFGLAPAWQASRTDVNGTLKQEARGGSAAGRQRALSVFVTAEIALALVLLVGAGLLLTSFRHLRAIEPGFDASRVLTAPAYLPDWKYDSADKQREFFRRAVSAIGSLPGVASVAAVNALPLSGDNSSGSVAVEGAPAPNPAERPNADRRAITPDYFSAMGIGLLRGRSLRASDDERAQRVAVVSREFADQHWPRQDAIGKRLKLGRYESAAPWLTVVGLATDVRHSSLSERPQPVVYYPHAQIPDGGMVLVIRSEGAPASIADAVRRALRHLDPDLPADQLRPLDEIVRASTFDEQLEFSLLAAFAALALLLAAAGVYGVMSYAVSQRFQEFGIRLALGASRADILRLVARQGVTLTLMGLVLGLLGARVAASALTSLLVGVGAGDPVVFAGTTALLAAIALAACVIPARRALHVSAVTALRQ